MIAELDVPRLRAETPGCESGLIHFNNAGAALKPAPVIAAVAGHLAREELVGGYEAADAAAGDVQGFYDAAAALINGAADEIAFLDSATRAWHTGFYAMDWRVGDEVITSAAEYNSNMISFRHAAKRHGIVVVIAPDDATGAIDCAALETLITSRTRLICLSHIPTNDGMVQPAQAVGKIARAHGLAFLLDACQSIGQMPVDVADIGCTMLTATGRKYLRGPRGSGFLWVDKAWQDRLVPYALDTRSARWTGIDQFTISPGASRYELWENSVAAQLGLGAAVAYTAAVSPALMWPWIRDLAQQLRIQINNIPGFATHDRGTIQSGIVTFSSSAMRTEDLCAWLRRNFNINTSVSAVQLTRSDLLERGITHMVRASLHAFNTKDEIEELVLALRKVAAGQVMDPLEGGRLTINQHSQRELQE